MEEEKKDKKTEIPEKFKKIVEEIEQMKAIDLAELVKILEERFGVSSAPMAFAAPVSGIAAAPAKETTEEKSEFNVFLKEVGDKKIDVIKVVRDITQKGLKESKDLVDATTKEAQLLKEKVKKEEAEEIKKKFEAIGAKVELK